MKDFGVKKLYYSISEVSKLTGLEQYILRYWESEFDQLKPSKNRAGNRIYTNKDISIILKIKKLLRDEKYTIEGARNILNEPVAAIEPEVAKAEIVQETNPVQSNDNENGSVESALEELKKFLVELQNKL
ncbi:MAG: MerR family transcriptional regulator [Bacteroidetes bacterium]|nr:MerR family transcriptional regulator [Bacteroidota bacterium]MBU1680252.1 MerR family transcriptional regulator [Bacteroidota bacterium]